MKSDLIEKGARLATLHQQKEAFVIPNPWDAGSARLLTSLGFQALTTTDAGLTFALGRRAAIGSVTRDEVLENAKVIADATSLPVAGDLSNGFAQDSSGVAETVRLASSFAGLVGGSIEDATGDRTQPIFGFELAVERVTAAVEAARSLPHPFVLVGRAENYLYGKADLRDTIRRLQAFEEAGADVLFAPGISTEDEIRSVCSSVGKPVNFVMGRLGPQYTVAQMVSMGVRRISLGSTLCRTAYGAFIRAAQEIQSAGTFTFINETMPFDRMNALVDGTAAGREPGVITSDQQSGAHVRPT